MGALQEMQCEMLEPWGLCKWSTTHALQTVDVEVPVQTLSGIERLTLEALDDIADGEEITNDYDAAASATSKQHCLTFWQWQPPRGRGAQDQLRVCLCWPCVPEQAVEG
jgi:hypothetical protein